MLLLFGGWADELDEEKTKCCVEPEGPGAVVGLCMGHGTLEEELVGALGPEPGCCECECDDVTE